VHVVATFVSSLRCDAEARCRIAEDRALTPEQFCVPYFSDGREGSPHRDSQGPTRTQDFSMFGLLARAPVPSLALATRSAFARNRAMIHLINTAMSEPGSRDKMDRSPAAPRCLPAKGITAARTSGPCAAFDQKGLALTATSCCASSLQIRFSANCQQVTLPSPLIPAQ
jgi:hypothetical protein